MVSLFSSGASSNDVTTDLKSLNGKQLTAIGSSNKMAYTWLLK